MTQTSTLNLERIAEMVLGIDQLTRDLPHILGKLRSTQASELAQAVPLRSQALRLAIAMEAPASELLEDVAQIERDLRRLDRLSQGTRLPATAKLALKLGVDLATELSAELAE